MLGLSRRFIAIVIIAAVIKVCLVILVPFSGDFVNWVRGAQIIWIFLVNARLPLPNAYVGLMTVLSPFYGLWMILPVSHPSLPEMIGQYSASEMSLVLVMKAPSLTFDAATGVLLYRLIRERTASERNGGIAFLVWYLNPYNWYWIYYYGGFDVIPVAIMLLAVFYGNRGNWVRSGLCASAATIMRLFPILLFPFLVFYAARRGLRPTAKMLVSLFVPLGAVFFAVAWTLGSWSGVVPVFARIPYNQPWLEDFWGFPLDGANAYFKLTPFLLLLQLYVIIRYWRNNGSWLEDAVGASLLLMLVSQPQGNAHHFLWVSPFLSAYFALGRIRPKLLTGVYVAAALFPPWFDTPQRLLGVQIEPLFGGIFVGLKGIVLLILNSQSMEIRPQLQWALRYLSIGSHLPAKLKQN